MAAHEVWPVVDQSDRALFEAHFSQSLEEADLVRAVAIFVAVGAFNERSLATQFHIATHAGKLEETLQAFEKLVAPDSWIYLVPTPEQKAAEVKMFMDVVYTSVILESSDDPWKLKELADQAEIPNIFKLLGRSVSLN